MRPILGRIEDSGLRHCVHFFNLTSQRQLAGAYRFFAKRNSVFALTSFYEPFGLAPIEAAACGLTVVATQNGGPTEIFEDGSAVLVDPENPSAIASGLLRALMHAPELSERGMQRVLSRYTWAQTARGYLQTIERGLSGERSSQPVPTLDAGRRIKDYLSERA